MILRREILKGSFHIVEGLEKVDGIEAKSFLYSNLDFEFVKESRGIILGSPTYSANISPDFYNFIMNEAKELGFSGKLGGVFATEQFVHGGANYVMNTLIINMLCKGIMIYSSGASYGMPVIHVGPVGISPKIDEHKDIFEIYGKRFADQCKNIYRD